ncbi:hypothetical protein SMCB_0537 [Serpentinimonas maccroryi]|uniref:Uncharacterized protein n=1 Tax=Serpentinimonas maccroryi TaxID=1458426 RepID=A0A060NN09_9BURK|nr:hypothetical protein SMCB_0537 [Serpentinimonas maccroryi]
MSEPKAVRLPANVENLPRPARSLSSSNQLIAPNSCWYVIDNPLMIINIRIMTRNILYNEKLFFKEKQIIINGRIKNILNIPVRILSLLPVRKLNNPAYAIKKHTLRKKIYICKLILLSHKIFTKKINDKT